VNGSPSPVRTVSSVYRRELRWFLLPYLSGALALIGVPALLMLGLSFFTYDAISPPVWAGTLNFQDVAAEPQTWVALRNTLYFIFLAVPLRLLLALGLALLFNAPRRGVGVYRMAVYLPTTIPDVAYALIWLWIVNPFYGPLNLVLRALGLPAPDWLTDFNTAKLPFVMMSLLQIGESFVILLAGLHAQSREVHEAAAVDGASRWQRLRHMTLPLLSHTLALVMVVLAIGALQEFTSVFVLTNGGPGNSTYMYNLLIYQEAFQDIRFGTATAAALIQFVFIIMITIVQLRLIRPRWSY